MKRELCSDSRIKLITVFLTLSMGEECKTAKTINYGIGGDKGHCRSGGEEKNYISYKIMSTKDNK